MATENNFDKEEHLKTEIMECDPNISEEVVDYMIDKMNDNTIDAEELFADLALDESNACENSGFGVIKPGQLTKEEIDSLIDKMPDKTPIRQQNNSREL